MATKTKKRKVAKKPVKRRMFPKRREVALPSPVVVEVDFDDADAVLRDFCRAEKEDPEDWSIGESRGFGSFGAGTVYEVTSGRREYVIVQSEEVMRDLALAVVKQDLDQEPEIFNRDFIERHIDMAKLRDASMSDVVDSNYDRLREDAERDPVRFMRDHNIDIMEPDEKRVREFARLEADDDTSADKIYDDIRRQDEEGQWDAIGEEPEVSDSAVMEAAEDEAKRLLSDPMEYLVDIYGREDAAKQAIEIAGIDIDAAAEEAVDTDGAEHFLNHYDGTSDTTPAGFTYWRTN